MDSWRYRSRQTELSLRHRARMALHNVIGHPMMEVCMWQAMLWDRIGSSRLVNLSQRAGNWFHNATLPPAREKNDTVL